MGPIALFDKSFLQALSIDESVWFDQFYIPNISPLFYVETLADLDKEISRGRTAEQVVGNIAEKTPQLSGAPNVHHRDLLLTNLMGQPISMSNRPIVAGGRPVVSKGKKGVNIDTSPEAIAFNRWQDGEYLEIEREFSRAWRSYIKSMSFENSSDYAQKLGIDISQCKSMNDAFSAANQIVNNSSKPYDLIAFIVQVIGVPREYQQEIVHRYQVSGFPPLNRYAPYAAHVIKVEVFFHICVSRGLISADRPSNKIDIAYLHYLPFCNVFISGDKLHRNTASLFLKGDQRFIWGPDLKADLKRINKHYLELPQEVKERGIISFASKPPTDGNFLTAELWDMVSTNWRNKLENVAPLSSEANDNLVQYIKGFAEALTLPADQLPSPEEKLDSLAIQRSIRRKRGSWYQVPKDLECD
ncbi:hypothetical protein [Aurantivibrio plasticivorans]